MKTSQREDNKAVWGHVEFEVPVEYPRELSSVELDTSNRSSKHKW